MTSCALYASYHQWMIKQILLGSKDNYMKRFKLSATFKSTSGRPERGASMVEFALIASLLFALLFITIDLARLFHSQTLIDNALAYAIKRAQSEFNTVVEFDQLDETDVKYQQFQLARAAIVQQFSDQLKDLRDSKTIEFYEAHDLDEMRTGVKMQPASAVAYLLPGKASVFTDPKSPLAAPLTVQNRNICRSSHGRPVGADSLLEYWSSNSDNCAAQRRRGTETFNQLKTHYPLELVSKGTFNGIIMKGISVTGKAAGYLPSFTDGPPPSSLLTPTPTATPTLTNTAQPTPSNTNAPTQTPYLTLSSTPTVGTPTLVPTIAITATLTATPTSIINYTPTAVPTTPAQNTPVPTMTPTRTPVPTVGECQFYSLKKSASMNNLKSALDDVKRWSEANNDRSKKWRLFEGSGANLACLNTMVTKGIADCEKATKYKDHCVTIKDDGHWMNRAHWAIDDWSLMRYFFRDEPINAYMMSANLSSTIRCMNEGLTGRYCEGLDRLRQPYDLRAKFMDKDCKLVDNVDPSKVCGELILDMMVSPISVILNGAQTQARTVVRFKLNPTSDENWLIWRADANTPLLVIDHNRNQIIDDGSELFGNWTFDLTARKSKTTPWKNGFEALAMLDKNNDQILDQSEIADLQLWFDRNSNAITDIGELKALDSLGITQIELSVQLIERANRDLLSQESVHAHFGGGARKLNLLDWYSHSFFDPVEALRSASTIYDEKPEPRVGVQEQKQHLAETTSVTSTQAKIDLSGIWVWSIEGATESDGNTGGVFMLLQKDAKIAGFSLSEQILTSTSASDIRSLIDSEFIFGYSDLTDKASPIKLGVIGDKQKTLSEAYLDENGALIGTSRSFAAHSSIESATKYHWKAQRIQSN